MVKRVRRLSRKGIAARVLALDAAASPPPDPPAPSTPDQITVLSQQLGFARNAFFRLAQVRASDRVKFEGLQWDQATEYIQAEMSQFDQGLAQQVGQ